MNKHNIQTWISWLRIVATVAIVMSHTCSTLTFNPDLFTLTPNESFYISALHKLCLWSVPVFLMITGALLLRPGKKISYEVCMRKYVPRITACLFLFGTVFGAMKIVASTTNRGGGKSLILNSLYSVISGESFDHLWYLYALIGIYMILPILKAFVDSDKDGKGILWALGLLLTFDFVFPLVEGLANIHIEFYIPLKYTIFYLLLGYFMVTHEKLGVKLDIVLIVLMWVLFLVSEWYGKSGMIAAHHSPVRVVMAIAIFDLFRHIKSNGNVERLWKIDRLCFGVYLIHPVFIHLSYRFLGFTPVSFGGLYPLATFVFCIIFTLCSFIGTWLMIQIPFIKRLIN